MSVMDKIKKINEKIEQLTTEAARFKKDSEEALELHESTQTEIDSLRSSVDLALEVAAEFRQEEQEAFSTLCVQGADGGATTADLISYASLRELEHPDPSTEETETKPPLQEAS